MPALISYVLVGLWPPCKVTLGLPICLAHPLHGEVEHVVCEAARFFITQKKTAQRAVF
jgi:hypothetical protein